LILSKGLSFVPTRTITKTDLITNLDNFQQSLIQRASPYHFDIPRHPLIPNSTHHSSSLSDSAKSAIHQYISDCKHDIDNTPRQTNMKDNLTNRERQTLNRLKLRTDIIIKKADKGDTIVVETIENYIKDGMTHLSDTKYYHRLEEDINPTLCKTITKFLINAQQKGLNTQLFKT